VESNDNQYGWLFGGRSLLWEAPISGSISDIFDCKSQQQHQQHRQHLGSEAKRRMVRVDWSGQGLKGCLPAKIVFGNATIYQLDLSRNGTRLNSSQSFSNKLDTYVTRI
jgi:hypothetical protein